MHACMQVLILLCWTGSKDKGRTSITKRHRLHPTNCSVNLRRSNERLLTKRMGRTHMIFMFEFHMFLLHFFMLHPTMHKFSVLPKPS